ncbi:MAG: hypothetical protein ABW179_04015 [Methylobacterium sp.]
MPTLVRLLSLIVLLVGAVVGVMAALVTFVEPRQTEIVVPVPLPNIAQTPAQAPAQAPAPASPGVVAEPEPAPDATTTGSVAPVTAP